MNWSSMIGPWSREMSISYNKKGSRLQYTWEELNNGWTISFSKKISGVGPMLLKDEELFPHLA